MIGPEINRHRRVKVLRQITDPNFASEEEDVQELRGR